MNFLKAIVAAGLVVASTQAFGADITGAGATFPFPVYSKWADAYKKETGNGLNYQSIGSGAGIKQILAKTVTFGATDAPLKPEALEKDGLAQWPMVMGAIVPVVNLEGIKPGELVFDGETLAKIYLGTITKWDDPAIAKLNPKLKLPPDAITVVRRSDGSGTTFNFTDYLSKASAEWKSKVGSGTAVEHRDGQQCGQDRAADRGGVPGGGVQCRLGKGSRLLPDPDQPARRSLMADHGGDLHSDAQGCHRQSGVAGSRQVLQMGLREGRQDGGRARLYSDAGAGREADRKDLVGRDQELSSVIAGRALRASPESITPVFVFGIYTPTQRVWIPGLRQEGASRNDDAKKSAGQRLA
jgi:hypothetical protein